MVMGSVGYGERHRRVYKARGAARMHVCIDCLRPAAHWSQIHGTDGTETTHYEPRCVSCHRKYDYNGKKPAHLGSRLGVRASNAKLSDKQVSEIRDLLAAGTRYRDIAAQFGCSTYPIYCIAKGTAYNGTKVI